MRQRELKLKQSEEFLSVVNGQVDSSKPKFDQLKVQYDHRLEQIRDDIKSKVKENKRLYQAFKSIRDSNESLRLKVSETDEEKENLCK